MTTKMSQTILSELGLEWDEGMTIPVANAENKYYEDDVSAFISWHNQILDSSLFTYIHYAPLAQILSYILRKYSILSEWLGTA